MIVFKHFLEVTHNGHPNLAINIKNKSQNKLRNRKSGDIAYKNYISTNKANMDDVRVKGYISSRKRNAFLWINQAQSKVEKTKSPVIEHIETTRLLSGHDNFSVYQLAYENSSV